MSSIPPAKTLLAAVMPAAVFAAGVVLSSTVLAASPYATEWVQGHNSRTRLIVGGAPGTNGTLQRYAALEIVMPIGWKTYWRQPGSAGGIPPNLSWQGSTNLKNLTIRYPAPIRMADPSGESIGYKKSVVFPLALEPVDPSKRLVLDLKAFFGVCREICIPAQAAFKVTINSGLFQQTPPELSRALRSLPVTGDDADDAAPVLAAVKQLNVAGGRHALTFDVRFPGGTKGADIFTETGDHEAMAMATKMARPVPGTIRYKVVVSDPAIWASLGKTGIVVTMVSDGAAREVRVPRP
jgi:DsbC/DsbD-like thiol-disulfide interchange protein